MLKQTSPVAIPSYPNPKPLKKDPFSKIKIAVELICLRFLFEFFICLFCFKYNSWVKANTYKHGFVEDMKKKYNRQERCFSFEEKLWLK